ncbi:putative Clathrin heavy chain [Paratrimastix pyriformis]|uniref:Clathrin heavy chain n=1 Tax=Paratrimastix pyriformis TaxID=342808 RepID=A0ABQ8UVL9_9EUKA|nr:putative Clathrin heavy chain [Paratrimastix pyriformis]
MSAPTASMLEIEHVIGGQHSRSGCFHAYPLDKNIVISAVGGLVCISDLTDPHQQAFLRGHTDTVTALAVSEHYIVSGQLGPTRTRDRLAPVIVWDYARRERRFQLDRHTLGIMQLAITADERFLAVTGEDTLVSVWDLRTGALTGSAKAEQVPSFIAWAPPQVAPAAPGRRAAPQNPAYLLVMAVGNQLRTTEVAFSQATQSYNMARPAPCGLPHSGFLRTYPAGQVCLPDILTGTDSGELCVFSFANRIYRRHFPAGPGDMAPQLVMENPTSPTQAVAFAGLQRILRFPIHPAFFAFFALPPAMLSRSGLLGCGVAGGSWQRRNLLSFWDLSEYRVLARTPMSSRPRALRPLEVAAHRGAVTALAATEALILSGGEEGTVRCWSRRTHELIAQFGDHTRPITGLQFDLTAEQVAHSCGPDHYVTSYDLKTERTLGTPHFARDEAFTSLTQKATGEQELITGSASGRISVWDRDYRDPVVSWQERGGPVTSVAASPSGRFLAVATEGGDLVLYDLARIDYQPAPSPAAAARRAPPEPLATSAGCGHSAPCRQVAWAPDEKQLLSVGDDGAIRVWNFYPTP